MKLDIIYQDDDIVLVSKPADLLTIPDRYNALKPNLYTELNKLFEKVYIVHRLDRETSGIVIFAKNEAAHRHLSLQFENHETAKIYLALVEGAVHNESGEIDKPIGPHPSVSGKMIIAKKGKNSLTHYKVIERFKHFTLLEADIKTGRTHQIRVHFQSIGYPLAVDALYGKRNELFLNQIKTKGVKLGKYEEERPIMTRTTLHALRLTFTHPTKNEVMTFEAPAPKDIRALIAQLQKWGK
jgi:23S rRNA pseudouridine1911/1915/1917 synthase